MTISKVPGDPGTDAIYEGGGLVEVADPAPIETAGDCYVPPECFQTDTREIEGTTGALNSGFCRMFACRERYVQIERIGDRDFYVRF